jgi:hypothetical protein
MGRDIIYNKCKHCQNESLQSDYDYIIEELNETCDVCGYYHNIKLTNKCEDGNYPDDWKPEYEETEGNTGFVINIFTETGNARCLCHEENLEDLIEKLENDDNVIYFGITHKGKNGYKTQIFEK